MEWLGKWVGWESEGERKEGDTCGKPRSRVCRHQPEEVNARSPEVTYTEVQPKGGDDDTHMVMGATSIWCGQRNIDLCVICMKVMTQVLTLDNRA